MGIKPKYKSNYKNYVIAGLQAMIDDLNTDLRITDRVSLALDTEEEHRKTFEDTEISFSSPEELRQSVEESKDRSIQALGHIQKRISEVKALKEAFEAPEVPSTEILNKTYFAFRSSLVFKAIDLCFGNPREEIFAVGINGLGPGYSKKKREEIEHLGKTIGIYSEALMFGFNVSPFFWNEFPFDN